MKRSVNRLRGIDFFEGGLPVYVNRAAENFDMLEHTHDFIELTYVAEGSGVHYIGEQNLRVAQGDVFFIPVGVPHVFRPAAPGRGRELIVYNCLFPTDYLLGLERRFPDAAELLAGFREAGRTWLRLRDPGEFRGWFKELYREYAARRPGCEAVLTTLVVRMLVELHRRIAETLPESRELLSGAGEPMPETTKKTRLSSSKVAPSVDLSTRQPSPSIEQAIRRIEERYAERLTLAELALLAGLSERQFSRLFVRQTGMNFSAFLQNTRIEAACGLLLASRMTVSEIAATVGYGDLKFFHRLFKRKTGTTPLAYRQERGRGESPFS
ncbi:AraC family transcriptional regulator [Saccharibacillus sp. O23]|uniref:AraC family transcriptional regulator n=1 Tax=Saccharibacillus sp. O23 TaxID=2009338 RepID=UPI000B4E18DE|nr:AraC family transcriptional regulator [Saccharibacillus sp. O23]OWR29873.1 AraC family transcriptional regulator [Saccharibacillus sp. O23]